MCQARASWPNTANKVAKDLQYTSKISHPKKFFELSNVLFQITVHFGEVKATLQNTKKNASDDVICLSAKQL